jgi:hypothetical protein
MVIHMSDYTEDFKGTEWESSEQRYARWIWASHGLAHFQLEAVKKAQELGRQDLLLIEEDLRRKSLEPTSLSTIEESLRLNGAFFQAEQWVLTAYELVRIIHEQYFRNDCPQFVDENLKQKVLSTRNQYARIRMPLAKMEAAHKYSGNPGTDEAIPERLLHTTQGLGWCLSRDYQISRRELSDSFLTLLIEIRHRQEQQ